MKKSFLKDQNRRITLDDLTQEDIQRFNNKTMAIRTQYLRPSKTHRGYYVYECTYIQNGVIKYREIYGRNQQEAVNRFNIHLKFEVVGPKYGTQLSMVGVLLIIFSIAIISISTIPLTYIAIPCVVATIMGVSGFIQDRITKKVLRRDV